MNSPELIIKGSKTMPAITFSKGKLDIVGRSIPTESRGFYDSLFNVLYTYSNNPENVTEINFQLEYLNSDSNRSILNILLIAEKLYNKGKNVVIRWFYKNNDSFMLDQGNIFKSLIEVPFCFEPII